MFVDAYHHIDGAGGCMLMIKCHRVLLNVLEAH